jgi:phosphatidylglycerophosphate synthase
MLDPLADKALIISAVLLLSRQDHDMSLSNWVVVAVIGKDLWVIIGFIVIYLVTDRLRAQPTRSGKICTFGQLFLVGSVLLAPYVAPYLDLLNDELADFVVKALSWTVVGLCVLAGISYTRLGLRFIAREQKPLDESGPGGAGYNGSD